MTLFDWEQRKLGDVVKAKSGWSPSEFKIDRYQGILFIKVDDLNNSQREQDTSKWHVYENRNYPKIKKLSTIFPKRGAAILTNKVRILSQDCYMDTNIMALEPEKIEPDFLYSFIEQTGLFKIADTSTIPQINNKHINPYKLWIPYYSEQKKIANLLKIVDNIITLQQRKLKQLKMIHKIIAYNLVASHSLKKTNTVAWKTKYLKNIAKIYQPTTITQNDLLDIGIPVFGANSYIGFYSKANHDTDQVTICARGASTGNPSYVKGPVWITGNSMVINVNENSVNKRFLYTLLTFTNLKRFVTGGAQPQITRESLNSLKLALPSIKTQNDVSVILEKLNIEVQNIQSYNNSLKKLKQSLLQNMFI